MGTPGGVGAAALPNLVVLMRHARMQSAVEPSGISNKPELFEPREGDDSPGAAQLLTEAGWSLAETLHELNSTAPQEIPYRVELWHENTAACRVTAEKLAEAYNKSRDMWTGAPKVSVPPLNESQSESAKLPDPVSPYANPTKVTSWLCAVRTAIETQMRPGTTDARAAGAGPLVLVVVGHDPRMSWLLDHLIRKHRPPVPALSHTEMIACEWNEEKAAKPVWALSPTDKKAEAEVVAKVKSKMDTGKIFAGVLTAVMTFVAKNVGELDGWRETVGLIGIALLGVAVALYLFTMFWYDRLLMPRRFWAVKAPTDEDRNLVLMRPPSSSTWVLYQNMQLVWRGCFIPATIAAALGLTTYIVAVSQPSGGMQWAVLGIAAVVLTVFVGRIAWTSRPDLGVQD